VNWNKELRRRMRAPAGWCYSRNGFQGEVEIMHKTLLVLCGAAFGLGLAPAYAQTLQMADAPAAQVGLSTPGRGTSMAQVEARYGTPSDKVAAVGDPPISRWVYSNFTVYFEGHHVIHAVATQPGTPAGK
jgi:hypothetical protein